MPEVRKTWWEKLCLHDDNIFIYFDSEKWMSGDSGEGYDGPPIFNE